ncbi:hypothetical protein [Baaleninema sp.]|uniref:hypothetical protein n=1 Tax=Baaleninema sp. TaxID=3101197 RepID=UPI003D057D83
MARLKRWESPRRQGRNYKGKGGSARSRQLKKQQNLLRKKLKSNALENPSTGKSKQNDFPVLLWEESASSQFSRVMPSEPCLFLGKTL